MVFIDPIVTTPDALDALTLLPNQYVIIDDQALRYDGAQLVAARYTKIKGFSPKNVEQRCLFDLLDNDDVPVKVVIGIAGSGKTKAALQYGLHKVAKGVYDRLLVVRQPAVVGEEIGHLKGSLADKLAPWQSSIVDNLEGGRYAFDELVRQGRLEFDIPAYMQGRDLKRTFVVVDEAQMLTLDQVRMLGSRVSDGSCIVFIGDTDQIMNKRYVENNGLKQVVGKLAGNDLFGFMRLTKSVRSDVAEMFATMR